MFLLVLTVFVIAMCVVYVVSCIYRNNNNNIATRALNSCIVLMFIIIYDVLSTMFTVNLFVYRTRLVVNNVTTKEDNTKRFNTPFGNPYYKRNCWLNWCDVLFPTQNVYSILSILKWDNNVNSNSNSNNEVNTVISNNQLLQRTIRVMLCIRTKSQRKTTSSSIVVSSQLKTFSIMK